MAREDFAIWRCGRHAVSLARPRIMGVLEVGGEDFSAEDAIERGKQMLDEGADFIDVCADVPADLDKTKRDKPISSKDEAEAVVPVVRGLVAEGAVVCVSTRHADLAKMCTMLGASVVNDPEGFTDPEMIKVAAESDCGCIVLCDSEFRSTSSRRSVVLDQAHTPIRPVPSNRRFTLPEEAPIMREIMGFIGDQARALMRAGVSRERICVDPGPGLNKTTDEDVVIQRNAKKLTSMGYPLLQAVARKKFSDVVTGSAGEAQMATAGLMAWGIRSGARILRVYDVASAARAVNAYWAMAVADPRQGFVSLGSNVGDRLGYLSQAVRLIDEIPLTRVIAVSSAYETEPAYGIATPVANAVAEIRTELHPLVLLDELMAVEDKLDRVRDPKQAGHGPRTIDCDLAWVERETHAGAKLTLPHAHLGERDYILVPMEDLMHDPVRFLVHAGVEVYPPEQRVGHVTSELGQLDWK